MQMRNIEGFDFIVIKGFVGFILNFIRHIKRKEET